MGGYLEIVFVVLSIISIIIVILIACTKGYAGITIYDVINIVPLTIQALGSEFKESLVSRINAPFNRMLLSYLNDPTDEKLKQISYQIYRRINSKTLTSSSSVLLEMVKLIVAEQLELTSDNFYFKIKYLNTLRTKAPFVLNYCIIENNLNKYFIHFLICDIKNSLESTFSNVISFSNNFIYPEKLIVFLNKCDKEYLLDINVEQMNAPFFNDKYTLRSFIIKQKKDILLFGGKRLIQLDESILINEKFKEDNSFLSLAIFKQK
ncbi:hypothetical protein H311_02815, partial [Anncaliia algerae PRA109]